MSACPSDDTLRGWLYSSGPAEGRSGVEGHLEDCPVCQAALGRLLTLSRARATSLHLPPADTPHSVTTGTAPAAPQSPPHIEGLEVIEELGRGGMGVVYLARQTALKRLVAIKVLLTGGHAGREDLARFRTEAEAVARLQHPNVVQVHQIGECDGRPYLCLEYVPGGGLDRRLAGVPQPPAEAAALIETLARAIQAAHDRGIVHRDLKPANVLLAPDGTPKITDFGLARMLDEPGQTETGAVMGTPSYMAPEQARGLKDVGPDADVYSLGAILYECLTGRPPFRGASSFETLEQVVTRSPVPPRHLNDRVPRDLETIALKCLDKEPDRRYPTAGELADDLRRFRAGQPIKARPVGAAGRLWRSCKRNPVLATLTTLAASLALTLAVGGPALAYRERQARERAEDSEAAASASAAEASRQRDRARAAADQFFIDVSTDPRLLAREPGTQALRRQLLQRAGRYYEALLHEQKDDPTVRTDTARLYLRLGEIERDINPGPKSLALHESARRLLEEALADSPGSEELRSMLGKAWYMIAFNQRAMKRWADAEASFARAAEARANLVADFPSSAQHASDLATTYNNLGILKTQLKDYDAALRYYGQAREIEERLVRDHPRSKDYARDLAGLIHNIGMLEMERGSPPPAALKQFEEARERRQKLLDAHPRDPILTRDLANSHNLLARLYSADPRQAARARQNSERAVTLLTQLTADNPLITDYRVMLITALDLHGGLLMRTAQRATAIPLFEKAINLTELLLQEGRSGYLDSGDLADMANKLGWLHWQTGALTDAASAYRRAYAPLTAALKKRPGDLQTMNALGAVCDNLGLLANDRNNPREALGWFDQSVALLERTREARRGDRQTEGFLRSAYWGRAESYRVLRRYRESLLDFDRAVRLSGRERVESILAQRAVVLARLGRHDRAAAVAAAVAPKQAHNGITLLDLARALAVSSATVRQDTSLGEADRDRLSARYAEQALALLDKANNARVFTQAKHFETLTRGADLDPLRSRDELKALIAKVKR